MVRGDADGFAQDTGQVAVTVVGPDLIPVETWQLTELAAPDGAMRPDLVLTGTDSAFVTFDVSGRIWAIELELDGDALAALGSEPEEDTGLPDSGAPGGSGTDGTDPGRARSNGGDAGGCSVSPAGGGLLLVLLGLWCRRKAGLR